MKVSSAVLRSGAAGGPNETLDGAKPAAGAEEQTLEQTLPHRSW